MSRIAVVLLFLCLRASALADSVVVFNEIMYHPATNEQTLEWVELYDQNSVDVDLSGWRLAGGIDYLFPDGAVIHGGGYLVVAISPATLMANTGQTNVLGPFSGRLSNSGEKLELRDNHNRLMDSVSYGVDGNWPAGPDSSGVSLAKKNPNLSSKPAVSWTFSAQTGGTPGTANFSSIPLTGAQTDLLPISAQWRYDDTGTDLGSAWRAPGFDDNAWASGAALFFAGDGMLPAAKNTPLTPGRNTYYFRSTFNVSGNPAMRLLSFRSILDDGAVFYLNGVEIYRLNMPTGAVSYATMAASAVGTASYTGPFAIAASNLLAGQNLLAVELHQTTVVTNAGLRIVSGSGYAVSWEGNEADFSTTMSPALAPTNSALTSLGVEVFTSSNTNLASKLNDGQYGSGSSWSPATNDSSPYLVLRFNQTIPLSSIALGRDNGDTNEPSCGGTCTDRALGNYNLQYTLVTNPATVFVSSSNPSNGWTTLATVQYLSAQPGFTPFLRHRFDLAATNGNPIQATGVRVRLNTTNTIDEIEINPPVLSHSDAAFGMQLISTDILPPPPPLAFNEISAASTSSFWIEIMNYGPAPLDLSGVQVARASGTNSSSYTFSSQVLPPGGFVSLTQAQLGFGAAKADKLFLYTPGRFALIDAVTVQTNTRGRFPDGSGDWMKPELPTPGASNVFVFHSEIVFNEIMYHHRPFDPIPAVTSNATLLPITGVWRFNDSGTDLGVAWRAPGYDDSGWASGPALLSVNPGSLPAPTNTSLMPGRSTYYFRTSFNFNGSTSNLTLNLRVIVDDGAVFYLNGVEVYRLNMSPGPTSYGESSSTAVGDALFTGPLNLGTANLVQGMNALAVEVHQASSVTNGSGLTLNGGGLRLVDEGPLGGNVPMNLARQPGAAPFVIDSLSGYPIHNYLHLDDGVYGNANSWIGNSGNPGFAGLRFGGLFTISSFAFGRDNTGTYADRTLGFYALQYTRVASPGVSTSFTGNADTGWANLGTLNYQSAGTGLFSNPSRRHRYLFDPVQATGLRLLVPGTGISAGTCIDELEVNPPDSTGDIAFGAELTLTTTLAPAVPFTKSPEQWVEFYNRSANSVDLTGWQIDGGIRYSFPATTAIPPGGYLVVANDAAALKAKWPEVALDIVGNFSGKLSAGDSVSLKDAAGNPANTIQIVSSGWSDGGGSSLELADPRADNSNPAAWADSDESSRSSWQTVTYRMVAGQSFGNNLWNEFRLGLLDAGEVLVDDVSVIQDPDGTRQ